MKKLITSDWPQQQTAPQEHRQLTLNPKSHTALGLGVPVSFLSTQTGIIQRTTSRSTTGSNWSLIIVQKNLTSEPPRAVFYFHEEVGHESSSSTKLPAPDPEPRVLHTNWSCVLPVCLEWERGGHPAEDATCVYHWLQMEKNSSAQAKELLCGEKLNGVQGQSPETTHLWGKMKKKQHLLKMLFTKQFISQVPAQYQCSSQNPDFLANSQNRICVVSYPALLNLAQ